MRTSIRFIATAAVLLALGAGAHAQPATASPNFDPALAQSTGADEHGMRSYVLVILKTGPVKVPASPERDEMFKGHFANMKRLAAAGKLAVAGPFTEAESWRGLFVFAVADVEEARRLTATDPVIVKGEMVAEFHPFYGTAALMLVNANHERLAKSPF